MERPPLELAVEHFANDWDTIRPIQRNGREVENGGDGGVRAQRDQIDEDARDGEEPDGVDRSIGPLVNFVPDSRKGQHFVAGVGPDGSGTGLNGRHGGEVEDETGGHSEENASVPPNNVVEDLSDGLINDIFERFAGIATAVRQDNGIEPASYPGEAEGEGNGPRGFDFGILDFLSDVGGCVVIGHGPRS